MSNSFSNAYALLIGVGESIIPKYSLPVTVKDTKALKTVLCDSQLCGYEEQYVRLLHDKTASKINMLDGLDWLKQCTEKDTDVTVVVFYSGHGWLEKDSQRYYLIQHDADPENLENTALDAQLFTDKLRDIKAKRLLVIIDACHAQGMATSKEAELFKVPEQFEQVALPKDLVENLKQGAGRAVFTSSLGEQRSYIRKEQDLSVYTYHFLEALKGAGNQPGDSYVRLSNLMRHLSQAVPKSAEAMSKEQTPFFDFTTEDFPVALLLGGKGLSGGGMSPLEETAATTIFNQQGQQVHGNQTNVAGDMTVQGDLVNSDKIVQNITGNGNIFSGTGNVRVDKKE